jgi:NADH-quinone oxidoreductase subunit N
LSGDKDENVLEVIFFSVMVCFFTKLLFVSTHLYVIFIGLEGISLCLVLLVRKDNTRLTTEVTLKFCLYNLFFSFFFLIGALFFLGTYGELDLIKLFQMISSYYNANLVLGGIKIGIYLGIFSMFIFFFFKFGIFPFHFWVIEVYNSSSFFTISIISSIPKIGYLWVFFKFFAVYLIDVSNITLFLLCCSLCYSAFLGLGELNLNKLLGVSSISNLTLVLIPLVYHNYSLSLGFLLIYIFSILSVLSLFSVIKRSLIVEGSIDIFDLSNIFLYKPFLSVLLSINFFNLMGFPFFISMFFKLELLLEIIKMEHYLVLFVLVLNNLIATYYYLNILSKAYIVYLDFQKIKKIEKVEYFCIDSSDYKNIVISCVLSFLIFCISLNIGDIYILIELITPLKV